MSKRHQNGIVICLKSQKNRRKSKTEPSSTFVINFIFHFFTFSTFSILSFVEVAQFFIISCFFHYFSVESNLPFHDLHFDFFSNFISFIFIFNFFNRFIVDAAVVVSAGQFFFIRIQSSKTISLSRVRCVCTQVFLQF